MRVARGINMKGEWRMKKTLWVMWAVTGLMFLVLCGCGGGDSGSSNGNLKVTNNTSSGLAVDSLFLTQTSTNDWGPDQLPTNRTILSGDSATITNIPPGTYDSKVVLADNTTLFLNNFTITAGQTTNVQVGNAFKAAGKTITNPDAPATNVDFTYIPATEDQGTPKDSPDTASKVSDQYVVEIVK